jgi:hypothetical protein
MRLITGSDTGRRRGHIAHRTWFARVDGTAVRLLLSHQSTTMIDYQLDLRRRVVTTRVTGAFSFAELANYLHRLLRDPGFRADFDGLIVAADAAAMPPPLAVASLAPLVRAWSSRRNGVHWAFVLPSADARKFAERALRDVRLHHVTTQCFLSEPEAAAWLESVARAPAAQRPEPASTTASAPPSD